MRVSVATILALAACSGPIGEGDGVVDEDEQPEPGWRGAFVGLAHEVAGTAELVDAQTLVLRDFVYDGGGVDAHLFLVADGAAFRPDLELTGNLVGTAFEGEDLTLDLPREAADGGWDTVVLWCIPFAAEFGHAVLRPPG
ncbi:MAG: DM13 domain-containing protein [Alphaproteobacteria bacterium]|nr:DM13 domain-containing protein [Alphaproteobacteria bacterium]